MKETIVAELLKERMLNIEMNPVFDLGGDELSYLTNLEIDYHNHLVNEHQSLRIMIQILEEGV